jgi:hypothetical protein
MYDQWNVIMVLDGLSSNATVPGESGTYKLE